MKPTNSTPLAEASGQQLRRATAEAFGGGLFEHRGVTEGRPSIAAEYVAQRPDDDNDMSPPVNSGATALFCTHCSNGTPLDADALYCPTCGQPVPQAESVRDDDSRRVLESVDDLPQRIEKLDLPQLRLVSSGVQHVNAATAVTVPAPVPRTVDDFTMVDDKDDLAGQLAKLDIADVAYLTAQMTKRVRLPDQGKRYSSPFWGSAKPAAPVNMTRRVTQG